MTKQERNDIILQALQKELQEKPYAKDVLSETFELWVQNLIAQGNGLLASQEAPPQAAGQETAAAPEQTPEGATEPAPEPAAM